MSWIAVQDVCEAVPTTREALAREVERGAILALGRRTLALASVERWADSLLTAAQAAQIVGVSATAVRLASQSGALAPPVAVEPLRWAREDVETWARARRRR